MLNFSALLIGFVFGIGWGLAGYCPAPALVALAMLRGQTVGFVIAMFAGFAAFSFFERIGKSA